MKINFCCPTCGHNELTEILKDVTMDSTVSHILEIEGECVLGYSDSETNLGEISRFICLRCGDHITDKYNNIVTTNEDLLKWLKDNDMLEEDDLSAESLAEKTQIEVSIIGGVVNDVQGIPEDIAIIIKDYDCDLNDESLEEDEDGFKYIKSVWE